MELEICKMPVGARTDHPDRKVLVDLTEKLLSIKREESIKIHFGAFEEARAFGFKVRMLPKTTYQGQLIWDSSRRIRHTVLRNGNGGDVYVWTVAG